MAFLCFSFILMSVMSFPTVFSMGVNVFILSGQSNMVGEGGVANGALRGSDKWDGVIPPLCKSNPSILRLSAANKWEKAHEPLHSLSGTNYSGIGPGMPFANTILQMDPAFGVIGLVPCAVAGSYLISWTRNTTYYNNMLARTRAALARGGVLRGLLWYQGESDSRDSSSAGMYKARLVELFNDFRRDLESPSLPIIQVALASGFDYKNTIRRAQLELKLPNVKCVDADGLQLEPPSCAKHLDQLKCLHLSTPAQVQLGIMLAHAFLRG